MLSKDVLPPERSFAEGVRRCERSIDPNGHGLFAFRRFRKGEAVGRLGGRLVPTSAIDAYVTQVGRFGVQVHADWYVCPESAHEVASLGAINHSCSPNVGLSDALTLVAMREIAGSESAPVELLIDYAMTGSPAGGFSNCRCGAACCRGEVTRQDWLLGPLQAAYRGFFPPFKARAIEPGTELPCRLTAALDAVSEGGRGGSSLVDRYDALLFDVVGVLLKGDQPVAGAVETLARLNALNKPFFVVTNISSGSDRAVYDRLRRAGLPILRPEQVVSAGGIVQRRVRDALADGRRVAYVGGSAVAARLLGHHPNLQGAEACGDFDVLVIMDDEGFDWKRAADHVLSSFLRGRAERGRYPRLWLANADIAYPIDDGSIRFGPGVFVDMLKAGLAVFGVPPVEVELIGKPGEPLFLEAISRAGSDRLLMIGDQLETDVRGARAAGLDALLVVTGLGQYVELDRNPGCSPTYAAANLSQLIDGGCDVLDPSRSARGSSRDP